MSVGSGTVHYWDNLIWVHSGPIYTTPTPLKSSLVQLKQIYHSYPKIIFQKLVHDKQLVHDTQVVHGKQLVHGTQSVHGTHSVHNTTLFGTYYNKVKM
jgi:hypothetical protein